MALALSILACLSVVACRRSATLDFKDTEQRHFTAGLSGTELTELRIAEPGKSSEHYELRRAGYLVAVCPASANRTKVPTTYCRALVCHADTDCPPAHGLKQGTCINGLCIEPSQSLVADDAIMLCLAGTGASYTSPLQVERFALGLNCGQPCRVPSPCRQP